jgi:hypothetical protein
VNWFRQRIAVRWWHLPVFAAAASAVWWAWRHPTEQLDQMVRVGFMLSGIIAIIFCSAWWSTAHRLDMAENDLAELVEIVNEHADHLDLLRGINVAPVEEPATEPEIPAQRPDVPDTEPSGIPLQVQSALLDTQLTGVVSGDIVERELGGRTFRFRTE